MPPRGSIFFRREAFCNLPVVTAEKDAAENAIAEKAAAQKATVGKAADEKVASKKAGFC